jgi:hypothetical protein
VSTRNKNARTWRANPREGGDILERQLSYGRIIGTELQILGAVERTKPRALKATPHLPLTLHACDYVSSLSARHANHPAATTEIA